MKIKKSCEECGKVYTASKLHKTIGDHKYLCYVCWKNDSKKRHKLKLKLLREKDKELINSTPIAKKSSRVRRLLEYGIKLIKGEGEVISGDKVIRYEGLMK